MNLLHNHDSLLPQAILLQISHQSHTCANRVQDTLSIIHMVQGGRKSPTILVGSSIGAWIALQAAIHLPDIIQASLAALHTLHFAS